MGKLTDEQIEIAADKLIVGQPLTKSEQRLLDSPQGDFAMGQVRAYFEGSDDAVDCREMGDNLESLAVRMAAHSYLRWNEIDDETKDRYRHYARAELERRKREPDPRDTPTMMPPLDRGPGGDVPF